MLRDLERQDENGEDDGEHAVGERLDPVGLHLRGGSSVHDESS
jgi:hypothetical protein